MAVFHQQTQLLICLLLSNPMQTNGNKNAPPGIDSEQYAAALRVGLKWKLVIVRDVGHDHIAMGECRCKIFIWI